jgi:glycerate-2-kinase
MTHANSRGQCSTRPSLRHSPAKVVGAHLPQAPLGRTGVVGADKASPAMAKTVEDAWPGPLEGLVVTHYDHASLLIFSMNATFSR